jgi:hypothetical protein
LQLCPSLKISLQTRAEPTDTAVRAPQINTPAMAIPPAWITGGGSRKPRMPPLPPTRILLTALIAAVALAVFCLLSSSYPAASLSGQRRSSAGTGDKYLYWAGRVDCRASTAIRARASGTRSPASVASLRRHSSSAGNYGPIAH